MPKVGAHSIQLKRRDFVPLLLGGAAAVWPRATPVHEPARPVIGYLGGQSVDPELLASFRDGLSGLGYSQAHDVMIEFRLAKNDNARLLQLAGELVKDRVALIVATGGLVAARAAKQSTPTVPILFLTALDPVENGLVASFNRPRSNVTGVFLPYAQVIAKRLEMLKEMLSNPGKIAYLQNDDSAGLGAGGAAQIAAEIHTAEELGLLVYRARNERELEAAFALMAKEEIDALLVGADPFFGNQHARIVALAARHSLPTGCPRRQFAEVGGLMSYGPSLPKAWRQIGNYAGRILKGAKPDDLPVRILNDLELVINKKTADGLGLTVPPLVLAVADKVID